MELCLEVNEEIKKKVVEELRNYEGEFIAENREEIIIILSTGNEWKLEKENNILCYRGSRYGFMAQTPFDDVTIVVDNIYNDKGLPASYKDVTKKNAYMTICDNTKKECYDAKIVKYKTTTPKTWEVLPNELVLKAKGNGKTAKIAVPMMDVAEPYPYRWRLLEISP